MLATRGNSTTVRPLERDGGHFTATPGGAVTSGNEPNTYVLDSSAADLERLIGIARLQEQLTRDALSAAGAIVGARALDCGCGPIGALPTLAETVGPTGAVVGIERDAPTTDRARAVVTRLGLDNVTVVTGDLNDPECALDDAFDLAHSRCFLMHQPDAPKTLERIVVRLRPGGWLIAQEPLLEPPPQAQPPLPALASYWELMHEASFRLGVPRDTVPRLPASATAAGLVVRRCSVVALSVTPAKVLHLHAATVKAARERIVATGAGTGAQVDTVESELLDAAREGRHEWVTTPFFLTMACRLERPHD